MNSKEAFASAFKQIRISRRLTQEDFSDVSSRTYVSSLERAIKGPTLEKINSLALTMGVHPLTLLTLTYLIEGKVSLPDQIFKLVTNELKELNLSLTASA